MTSLPISIPDRALIAATGEDALPLLQRLVTADLAGLAEELKAGPCAAYTLLLTPQGRLRADFFVVRQTGGQLWLDVPAAQAEGLVVALHQYRLRSDAAFTIKPDVHAVLDATAEAGLPAFADPRSVMLGQRVWRHGASPEDAGQYEAQRIALGIVEPSTDCEPNALPLEYGLASAVSFSKGCYLGQELTARMHHRGLAKHEIKILSELVRKGQTVWIGEKPIGRVIAAAGDHSLVQLRRDRGEGSLVLVR